MVNLTNTKLTQPVARLSPIGDRASPSSGLEDEVSVGSAFRVLVAGTALPVGVGWSRTLGQRLHHLCDMEKGSSVRKLI